MNQAFQYVTANKGVLANDVYPYEAKNGECRYKSSDIAATSTGKATRYLKIQSIKDYVERDRQFTRFDFNL